MQTRIAFLGLGVMGYPMAGHLARAGHAVTVYNHTRAKSERWAGEHGGTVAETAGEAARDAAVVVACVGNDDDVRAVTIGPGGALEAMTPGAVFVDHTTTSAVLPRTLAAEAARRGLAFLDAPVSGGQVGAQEGRLTVMVGGEAAALERVRPLIACYAHAVRHMGPSGAGQLTKMVNRLRALSAEEVLRGATAPPGGSAPSYETTPMPDGRLVTETAETAYKARRQPRVPLLLGSNSADTAGNRVKATTKEQLFARFGQWSAQAKAAYDPDGSTDLAVLVARANDHFGQAEPARFAANAFAANGSPVYLYRFSYVQAAMRERLQAGTPHGGEIGYVFDTLSAGRGGAPMPEDQALARIVHSYWVNFAKTGDPNGPGQPGRPRPAARRVRRPPHAGALRLRRRPAPAWTRRGGSPRGAPTGPPASWPGC